MDRYEFRAFLTLIMSADPWPVDDGCNSNQTILISFANKESVKYGYINWLDAYHRFIA